MSVIYKILCDIRFLHEYYLTEGKGDNVFAFATQSQRMDFLQKQFLKGVPSISQDIEFVFPGMLQPVYAGYHLKLVRTYSGCKLAVGCRKKIIGGSTVFEPLVQIPNNLEIFIAIVPRTSLNQFSQGSLSTPVRGKWYYSNDNTTAARVFPFLSAPVAPRNNALQYEQGDIADVGAGSISMFLNNGAVDPWKPLAGIGYSSSADRLLLPYRFIYNFSAANPVTDADFVLKESNGNEIRRFTKTSTTPFKSVNLDFTPTAPASLRTIPNDSVLAESVYTLEVNASNGYQQQHRILFVDPLLAAESFEGLINIQPMVANPDFQLLTPAGNLPLTDGVGNPRIPLFEIWLKSKAVFLQYRNNAQKKLKLSPETTGLLKDVNGVLISENPVNLSYQPVSYQKQNLTYQLLPNPSADDPVRITDGKILAELMVPVSKIFPLQ